METPQSIQLAAIRQATNPFVDTPLARSNSSYAKYEDKALVIVDEPDKKVPPVLNFIHDSFRSLVLNPLFSCVGAKSAIQQGGYRIGHYAEMTSEETTAGLAYDLHQFIQEQPSLDGEFSTFVASFTEPIVSSEKQFEALLWQQLQQLHDLDVRNNDWDPSVSDDPESPEFSFSFGERGFFIVGLHPAASRFARRFAWPTLVFNVHAQFEALRDSGRFARMQEVIRKREHTLQGSLNANLSDFGEHSEARQYSGRPVGATWQCPFSVKKNND